VLCDVLGRALRGLVWEVRLELLGEMLAELVAQDRRVEPVEVQVATVDHLDQCLENLGLLTRHVAEAELLVSLYEG
jgi:hypothetical protein